MTAFTGREMKENSAESFAPLTCRLALQLAAPHTWPAAILPCLLAVACAMSNSAAVSFSLSVTLLVICVLMQAAVNTFNDYFDYVKGTDSDAGGGEHL